MVTLLTFSWIRMQMHTRRGRTNACTWRHNIHSSTNLVSFGHRWWLGSQDWCKFLRLQYHYKHSTQLHCCYDVAQLAHAALMIASPPLFSQGYCMHQLQSLLWEYGWFSTGCCIHFVQLPYTEAYQVHQMQLALE